MTRPQSVVLPILREALPGVSVVSWVPNVDYRTFPMVSIRRAGGVRHETRPRQLRLPVLEMTAVSADGLPEAEDLYDTALEALYDAVSSQTVIGSSHLHSLIETSGATDVTSPHPDTWAVTGAVQLGVRTRIAL